ncbi:hypothetical protein I316_01953 [Kwoniella heveanensis BCC8398]|uniref:Integrase zinc-binding domain-containing protein n=1 Tax=Kwoniella heveanensis BCC8398 TaxID=1296120 RepID=A0A1B9GYG6_9TREE|nr:hypothetical protein I316_01953 [Kwoniella heveanensis BCC8398]
MARKQTSASSYATTQTKTPISAASYTSSTPDSATRRPPGRGDDGKDDDRHSQPFLYSTARPPTGYSEVVESPLSTDLPSSSRPTWAKSTKRFSPPVIPRSEHGGAVQARVVSDRKNTSTSQLIPESRGNTSPPNPFRDDVDNIEDEYLEESLDDGLVNRVSHANTGSYRDRKRKEGAVDGAYTGDLYQRSDWAQSARASQLPTAWSRSFYAGKTPRIAGAGSEGDWAGGVNSKPGWNRSQKEYDVPPLPSPYGNDNVNSRKQTQHERKRGPTRNFSRKHTNVNANAQTHTPKHVQYAYEQDAIMDSPAEITPGLKKIGLAAGGGRRTPKSALRQGQENGPGPMAKAAAFSGTAAVEGSGFPASDARLSSETGRDGHRSQSTLPSVLDLDHLTPHRPKPNATLNPRGDTFPSHGHSRAPSPWASPTPSPAHFTGQIRAPSPSRSILPAPSSGYLLPPGPAQSQSPSTVVRPDRDPFADPYLHPYAQTQNHALAPALDFSKPRFLSTEDQSKLGRMSVAPPPAGGIVPNANANIQHQPQARNQNQPQPPGSRALLSPAAQNKLGRMSVAPARYTLPPQRKQVRLARESALGLGGGNGGVGNGNGDRTAANETGGMPGIPGVPPRGDSRRGQVPTRSDQKPETHKRSTSSAAGPSGVLQRLGRSSAGRWYLTWRPFISPCLSLLCALLLTVCHGVSDSSFGGFLVVGKGVFGVSRGGGVPIILGVWGWCQNGVNDPQCALYRSGDFANDDATFTIPQNSTLGNLSLFLTALTVLCWLLAAFKTITAFLHFYLFFALSFPFSHLVTTCSGDGRPDRVKLKPQSRNAHSPAIDVDDYGDGDGGDESEGVDSVMVEVEMRVKCQRVPYEGYEWVWWAWWAHRRSPVGPLFGLSTGALGLGTFALTCMLKKDIINATASQEVFMGHGAYIPLLTVVLTLDTFLLSIIYVSNLKRNFATLTNPPDPSPTVLLLPPSDARQMQHVRPHTNASSIFVPRDAGGVDPQFLTNTRDTYLHPNSAAMPTQGTVQHHNNIGFNAGTSMGLGAGMPGGRSGDGDTEQYGQIGLDEETIRWLAAYPTDEELVPLINSLRAKRKPNPKGSGTSSADEGESDFILSDVGLLYLRPSASSTTSTEEDYEGQALLVPPRGVIRLELLEDAHLDSVDTLIQEDGVGGEDGSAHNSVEVMMSVLGKTFWWNDMFLDVEDYIASCKICRERREEDRLKEKYEYERKRQSRGTRAKARAGAGAGVVNESEVPWTGIITASDISAGPGEKAASGGHGPVPRQNRSQSQMAADMAIAMRKAQEDAEM